VVVIRGPFEGKEEPLTVFPFKATSATLAFALACADWDEESWRGAGRGRCFLLRLEGAAKVTEPLARGLLGFGLRGAKASMSIMYVGALERCV